MLCKRVMSIILISSIYLCKYVDRPHMTRIIIEFTHSTKNNYEDKTLRWNEINVQTVRNYPTMYLCTAVNLIIWISSTIRTRRYVYWQDHERVRERRGMLIIFAFYENSSVLSSSDKSVAADVSIYAYIFRRYFQISLLNIVYIVANNFLNIFAIRWTFSSF